MAIIPANSFPGKTNPADSEYPQGKARNVTVASDGTGTPWDELIVNDWFGFFQSLLNDANITPNGLPDKVGASDYLNSLIEIIKQTLVGSNPAILNTLDVSTINNVNIDLIVTNANTSYNKFKINLSESVLSFQTRDENDNFITNDYELNRSNNGATSHRLLIEGELKTVLDQNGYRIIDGKIILGSLDNFISYNSNTGQFELFKGNSISSAVIRSGIGRFDSLEVSGEANFDGNIKSSRGQLASVWCYFNGVGGASINDSYNVSSVVRNSGGNYTVNFENPLPSSNYAAISHIDALGFAFITTRSSSSVTIQTTDFGTNPVDQQDITLTIFSKE